MEAIPRTDLVRELHDESICDKVLMSATQKHGVGLTKKTRRTSQCSERDITYLKQPSLAGWAGLQFSSGGSRQDSTCDRSMSGSTGSCDKGEDHAGCRPLLPPCLPYNSLVSDDCNKSRRVQNQAINIPRRASISNTDIVCCWTWTKVLLGHKRKTRRGKAIKALKQHEWGAHPGTAQGRTTGQSMAAKL